MKCACQTKIVMCMKWSVESEDLDMSANLCNVIKAPPKLCDPAYESSEVPETMW